MVLMQIEYREDEYTSLTGWLNLTHGNVDGTVN